MTAPTLHTPVETIELTDHNRDNCRTHLRLVVPSASLRPRYFYDVHDLVHIRSQVRLPELAYFAAEKPSKGTIRDIDIVVGEVGTRAMHSKVSVLHGENVFVYRDHLGSRGATFRIDYGKTIKVTVSTKLAMSPHVVYTNIIEALLRYVIASKDHVLQHSAVIVLGGKGVLLTAKTDTGKTSTILQLLEEFGGEFLSDDMTILAPDGTALSFPKPLTISAHTLKAVNGRRLKRHQRIALSVQSKVHSKAGRGIGLWLATRSYLPIMLMNAWTQLLIPPPKYEVQRLVTCDGARTTTVEQVILIARGERADDTLNPDEALVQLIANNADAYTFPPFVQVRDSVRIKGLSASDLELLEDDIRRKLVTSVGGVVHMYSRDDFGWRRPIARSLGLVRPLKEAIPAA